MASKRKCKFGVSKRTKKCLKQPRKRTAKSVMAAVKAGRIVPAKYQQAMQDIIDAEWMAAAKRQR